MNQRRLSWISAAAILLAAAGASRAQDRLTLKESVDLVLNNSQQVDMARESISGSELKVKEARDLYWPQANLSGAYTRMSYFGEISIPYNEQMMTVQFGTPNNYDVRATVAGQVLNWGRTARTIDISAAGVDLAKDGLAMTKFALSYQVVPLYYGTVFFKEAEKVLDENLEAFRKKLDILNQRYEAGLASSFDKNLMAVQISALEAQKVDFQNNIVKFRLAFNSLAGRGPETPFEPAAELTFEPAAYKIEDLLLEARTGRLELQQVNHQATLNRASLGLARTGNKPTVAASFYYDFRNGFFPVMAQLKGTWTAALTVSYPVFDGFRTRTQVAEAESALKVTETRLSDQERAVALDVETAMADLKATEQKFEIEKVKIRQAEESLRIAEERYRNGLLSATDLVDAQNTLETARLNALQLIYMYKIGQFNLDRSCGRTL
jgi:outer membrane protein TolC